LVETKDIWPIKNLCPVIPKDSHQGQVMEDNKEGNS